MPEVSVVIPLYNKGIHIERALRSVLAQTFQDLEVIVVDDGSKDDGVAVVGRLFDPRIRLIRQENQGVSVARNRGIQESRASLIAFLDADDAWKPNFLSIIMHLQDRYPGAGIYSTAYEFVEPGGKTWAPQFKGIPSPPWEGFITDYFYAALGIPPVWTSATAVPKDIFTAIGMFTPGEKVGQDIDMWLRIALKYRVAFSNQVAATYFRDAINGASRSGTIWPDRALKRSALKALQEGVLSARQAEHLREYVYKKDLEVVTLMLWAGEREQAKAFMKDNRTRVFWVRKFWLNMFLFMPRRLVLLIYHIKDLFCGMK